MAPHDDNPLSERALAAIHDGEAAWVAVSSSDWDASSWWRIGTALTLLRQQVLHETGINAPRGGPYNEAFARRLAVTAFATMESVTRSNLLYLMEPEIRIVLDRLLLSWPPDIRAKRTHPTTLAQYVRKALKPPPPPKPSDAKPATKQRPTDHGPALDALKHENATLREQIVQLTRERDEAVADPGKRADLLGWQAIQSLRKENNQLKRDLTAARSVPGASPDIAAEIGKRDREISKRDREIERLKTEIAKAEALLADAPGEAAKLARQLKAARTRAQNEARIARSISQMAIRGQIAPEVEKDVRVALHEANFTDSKQKQRAEKAIQGLGPYFSSKRKK